MEVLIRYFVDPEDSLGFAYFEVLNRLKFTIRALPIGFLDVRSERWAPYWSAFSTPIDGKYVNVVCSNDDNQYSNLYTLGTKNFAIVDRMVSGKGLIALHHYDAVLCPNYHAIDLFAAKVPVLFCPAQELWLKRVFEVI